MSNLIHPQMIIALNYIISVSCFISGFLLRKKSKLHENSSNFMYFMGVAALFGGFVHHLQLQHLWFNSFVDQITNHQWTEQKLSLYFEAFCARLWYIAILAIGFAEYYFTSLFIYPVIKDKYSFIKTYLKAMLIVFVATVTVSPAYFLVICLHVISHLIILIISILFLFKYKIKEAYILIFLVIYNLSAGIMQQLMQNGVIPEGNLNYNDWYHMAMIAFVIFLHSMFYYTKIIAKLNKTVID